MLNSKEQQKANFYQWMRKLVHKSRVFFRLIRRFFLYYLPFLNYKIIVKKADVFRDQKDPLSIFIERSFQKGQDEALQEMKNQYKVFKPYNVRIFLQIVDSIQSQMRAISLPETKSRRCIIHIPCWGSYGKICANYLLPSLLAKNNLPWLLGKVDPVLLFHCDNESKEEINNSSSWKRLNELAHIREIVLPERSFKKFSVLMNANCLALSKYHFFSLLQNEALKLAQSENGYVSFQHPDLLVSDSFYRVLFEGIQDKVVAAALGLSARYSLAPAALSKFYREENKSVLEIPNEDLKKFQLGCLSLRSERHIVSEERRGYIPSSMLIFKQGNGVVIRSKHYQPFLIDCSKMDRNFKMSAIPMDDSNLSFVINRDLPPDSQVVICDENLASQCELSDPAAADTMKMGGITDYIKLLSSQFLDLTPLQKFFLSHRCKVTASEFPSELKDMDDIAFIKILEKEIKC